MAIKYKSKDLTLIDSNEIQTPSFTKLWINN